MILKNIFINTSIFKTSGQKVGKVAQSVELEWNPKLKKSQYCFCLEQTN